MKIQFFMSDQEIMREMGLRLKKRRVERNLTQGELAKKASVALQTVVRVEQGKGGSLQTLIRIMREIGGADTLEGWVSEPLPDAEQIAKRGRERFRVKHKRQAAAPIKDFFLTDTKGKP